MRTTMKNESNAGSSRRPIRKSCAFALGAALLFASAPRAEASCYYLVSDKSAIYCPNTTTSGSLWVKPKFPAGTIPLLPGYVKIEYRVYNNYDYLSTLGWSIAIDRRPPHDLWVQTLKGNYERYRDLQAVNGLVSLAEQAALEIDPYCAGSACILIHQEDFSDMCRGWYANAWFYETYYDTPRISAPEYCF